MKILYLIIDREQGFSLVEVLIAISLLTGLGMAANSLFLSQNKFQSEIEQLDELDSFHRVVVKSLQEGANCNATLKPWAGSDTVPQTDISRIVFCDQDCDVGKTAAEVVPKNAPFITEAMAGPTDGTQWINESRKWEVTEITAPYPATRTGILNLVITYTLYPNNPNSKVVNRIAPLLLNFTETAPHVFVGCGSDQGSIGDDFLKDMCEDLGVENLDGQMVKWDEDLKKCVTKSEPVNPCGPMHEVVAWQSNGTATCYSLTRNLDTTVRYDPVDADCSSGKIPKVRLINSKVTAECN